MKLRFFVAAFGMLLITTGGLGCSSDDDENIGTLQQRWTIAGSTDPNSCAIAGAVQMRLVFVDSSGVTDATQFTPCNVFEVSIPLVQDTYVGSATFLGANGLPVSQTLVIPSFTVTDNQTTTLTRDFALSDFLPR